MRGANAFDEADHDALVGPPEAFEPQGARNPTYALRNHLALEVVAHMAHANVAMLFQGGTALHVRLGTPSRFSIDLDIRTEDPAGIEQALHRFVARFRNSDIQLDVPPEQLRIDGVRHVLTFGRTGDRTPLQILVEVVDAPFQSGMTEQVPLVHGIHDWQTAVTMPSLAAFAAQKLAVLGPHTIGKPVGPSGTHARQNQTVTKQIHDLAQLFRCDIETSAVAAAYHEEVELANRLRQTEHSPEDSLADARGLIGHLREPPSQDRRSPAYPLWAGFRDSRRWILDRHRWDPTEYRATGGIISRLTHTLLDGAFDWSRMARPIRSHEVPLDVMERLTTALDEPASWISSDRFAGDARLAWAWSPAAYW